MVLLPLEATLFRFRVRCFWVAKNCVDDGNNLPAAVASAGGGVDGNDRVDVVAATSEREDCNVNSVGIGCALADSVCCDGVGNCVCVLADSVCCNGVGNRFFVLADSVCCDGLSNCFFVEFGIGDCVDCSG